jgi:hypothetical protein
MLAETSPILPCPRRSLSVRPSFKVSAARARAEKLKLGKQSTLRGLASEDGKAEIVRRRARQATAASCLHIFLFFARFFVNSPWFTFSAFRPPVSGFSLSAFQLVASNPGVRIQLGHSEKLVAGLFVGVFHPQPVEQCALGQSLAGGDFEWAPEAGPPEVGAFSPVVGLT